MKTITLFLAYFFFSTTVLMAADVKIKFRIMDESGNKINNCEIRVYADNERVTMIDDASMANSLKLTPGKYYTIEVSSKHFITKRVSINTKTNYDFSEELVYKFDMVLELIQNYSVIGNFDDVTDYPVSHIYFDVVENEFVYDTTYYRSTRDQFQMLKERVRNEKAANALAENSIRR